MHVTISQLVMKFMFDFLDSLPGLTQQVKSLVSYFYVLRELKKAQMAKAAAEERALFTDRMATRSTTQSNRASRLIGKKMNRSVSLTIY